MRVTPILSVCGSVDYFQYASLSIPSFFEHNPGRALIVFSDRPKKLEYLQAYYPNLIINDFNVCEKEPVIAETRKKLEERTERKMLKLPYYMREHVHSFVSLVLPMAEHFVRSEYILKIDCDTMFAGQGFMDAVEAELEDGIELYLVERTHEKMLCFERKKWSGVGFTLWRRGGSFIKAYIDNFEKSEQWTIAEKVFPDKIPCKLIKKPGLHLVYVFRKNPHFSKQDLMEFLPAYIHLGGRDVFQKQVRIKSWGL